MPALSETNEFAYLWLIPVLPLFGALVNGVLGAALMRRFGPRVNHWISVALPVGSFCIAVYAFVTLVGLPAEKRILTTSLFPFVHIGYFDADMAFWMDTLSATMTLIVTGIGSLIHIYSIGYMHGDKSYWRFFAYLNLFTAAMLLLVLGDNFLVMFIGWEGVGLCSYLLISFWYEEKKNAVAGMKAFVVNRIGDFGFLLGLGLLFWGLGGDYSGNLGRTDHYAAGAYHGNSVTALENTELDHQASAGIGRMEAVPARSLRFDAVRARVSQDHDSWAETSPNAKHFLGMPLIALVCLLLFVGATGKSAQLPLYVWLPDAMAGPTPVSALIHAATMVTAGVYMVARLNFLFALSPTAMTVVACTGALTAIFAATIGLFQHDIKKVLAYSTVSQLGYMFIGVGVGAYWAGIFHLLTHAVFKALLFLGAGSVILGCHHEQDMRKMGGLKKFMPVTHWTYWAAALAITTAPFFLLANGFFSKDEILWKAFDAQHLLIPGWWIWLVGFIGAGLTSFYMWRSYYMTFTGEYRGGQDAAHDADAHADAHGHGGSHPEPHESPRTITWVLAALAILIIPTGLLGFWPLLGIEPLLEQWLHPVVGAATASLAWMSETTQELANISAIAWEVLLAAASVLLSLTGWYVARAFYLNARSTVPKRLLASAFGPLRFAYRVVYNKYYVDEAYDWLIVRRVRQLAKGLFVFDQSVIDAAVNLTGTVGRGFSTVDGLIDSLVVDGLVNGVAQATAALGRRLRYTQTGRIQTYLMGALGGVLVLVVVNYLFF